MSEQNPGQLNIQELINVTQLARQFIKVAGDQLNAENGAGAFRSIGAVEKFIEVVSAQQQQEQIQSNVGNLTTVDLNDDEETSTVDDDEEATNEQ